MFLRCVAELSERARRRKRLTVPRSEYSASSITPMIARCANTCIAHTPLRRRSSTGPIGTRGPDGRAAELRSEHAQLFGYRVAEVSLVPKLPESGRCSRFYATSRAVRNLRGACMGSCASLRRNLGFRPQPWDCRTHKIARKALLLLGTAAKAVFPSLAYSLDYSRSLYIVPVAIRQETAGMARVRFIVDNILARVIGILSDCMRATRARWRMQRRRSGRTPHRTRYAVSL